MISSNSSLPILTVVFRRNTTVHQGMGFYLWSEFGINVFEMDCVMHDVLARKVHYLNSPPSSFSLFVVRTPIDSYHTLEDT